MPNFCCVVGCSNRSNRETDRSFFNIPKIISNQGQQTTEISRQRRNCWLARINRRDWSPYYSRICSDHFLSGRPSKLYDTSSPDWAPSLNMGYEMTQDNRASGTINEEDVNLTTDHDPENGWHALTEPSPPDTQIGHLDHQVFDDTGQNGHCISQDGHAEADDSEKTETITMSSEDALAQETNCDKAWENLFLGKTAFTSFADFHDLFQQYQKSTFSVYRIFDCNRVETANFKRKAKLSTALRYASITFTCAIFGHQKTRGRNVSSQNQVCRSQSCRSSIKLTSSSRDQQLRILEMNLLHNHKLDQESFDRFHQARKIQQEVTKDELLDALSSVEVIIKDEEASATTNSPQQCLGELSSGQKQQLCSDVTGGINSTLVQMETGEFCKWVSILGDLLLKMEMDANAEVSQEKRRRNNNSSRSSSSHNKKRLLDKLETCDTDKEVCNYCHNHEPPKRVCPTRVIEWIDCDSCAKWYHKACLPSALTNTKNNYTCSHCTSLQRSLRAN